MTQDYVCQILSMFRTYSFNGATNQLLHPTSIPLIRVSLVLVYQSQTQIQDTKNSTKAHLNPANQHDTHKTDEPMNISRTKVHLSIRQQDPRNESVTMGQKGLKLISWKATNKRNTAPLVTQYFPPILGSLKIHGHRYSSYFTTSGYWLYWLPYLSLSRAVTHTLVILIHGYVY